ncbi:hypothetical protein AB0N07_35815 [Streptomyces sp. NPDC051172]|uniref:hypothetical protein n=1 Tax=Streptomyces sp. NPDC051172 TaxID=3155796 RepID=UPI0034129BFC
MSSEPTVMPPRVVRRPSSSARPAFGWTMAAPVASTDTTAPTPSPAATVTEAEHDAA